MEQSNEGYINIFQGQIGRYIEGETNPQYTGIYTDEITTCNILIVYGKHQNKARFSLIHADPSISLTDIQNEIQWVGQGYQIIRVKHESGATALDEKLTTVNIKQIKTIRKKHDAICIVFSSNKEEPQITALSSQNQEIPAALYNAEYSMRLCASYKFNIMHREIFGQLKMNDLFNEGHIRQNNSGKYVYASKEYTPEMLNEHLHQEIKYPHGRMLFDGQQFCNRENDLTMVEFSQETMAFMAKHFSEKENFTFKDVYMELMGYFHSKEPSLSVSDFQNYYGGQCTELARIYCYLTDRLNLLRSESSQIYWVKMVERYSLLKQEQIPQLSDNNNKETHTGEQLSQKPATKLSIASMGTKSQRDQILSELERITGNKWSSNTDGTKFWLKLEKTYVNLIMKHLSGKDVGKVTKNTPGTTIMFENAKLASLEKVLAINNSSTKEEIKVVQTSKQL